MVNVLVVVHYYWTIDYLHINNDVHSSDVRANRVRRIQSVDYKFIISELVSYFLMLFLTRDYIETFATYIFRR